ncbi:hypothetical protein [Kocuria marina]|uniref:hypothetical protein n=1 Tax=Kocuria marina TaxID=223184 RepID=UPI0022E3D997|nr:hypothetical protein [Kocuria marina]
MQARGLLREERSLAERALPLVDARRRMVDKTMTRWDTFRPFLLCYSVPLLLSSLLCFWIPVEYGEYKTGIHTEGATYSAVWFTRKMGHEQLRPGEVPAPVGTRTDRPGPTARDSHPMTTQGPAVPSERGDGSGPSTR